MSILDSNKDYWIFLKERPYWIRILSIEPDKINDFIEEYKIARRKRIIDKVEDTSNLLTIIQALMED
jgi:hypothetical protein